MPRIPCLAKKFEIIIFNLFGPVEGNSIILRIFHWTWNWNLYDSQVYCNQYFMPFLNQIWIPKKSSAKK